MNSTRWIPVALSFFFLPHWAQGISTAPQFIFSLLGSHLLCQFQLDPTRVGEELQIFFSKNNPNERIVAHPDGFTRFHRVIQTGNIDWIRIAHHAGADFEIPDHHQRDAFDLALDFGLEGVTIELIRLYVQDPPKTPERQWIVSERLNRLRTRAKGLRRLKVLSLIEDYLLNSLSHPYSVLIQTLSDEPGSSRTLEALLETGAQVNFFGQDRKTALDHAIEKLNFYKVKILVGAGADLNKFSLPEVRVAILQLQARKSTGRRLSPKENDELRIYRFLATTIKANQSLKAAVFSSDAAEITRALSEGAQIDAIFEVHNEPYTALTYSIDQGDQSLFGYILEHNPNPNFVILENGTTPLHEAMITAEEDPYFFRKLLTRKANPRFQPLSLRGVPVKSVYDHLKKIEAHDLLALID